MSFVDHMVTHNLGNFQASVNSKKKNTCNLEHMQKINKPEIKKKR